MGNYKPMSSKDRARRMRWLWPVQGGRCCHCWRGVVDPDDDEMRERISDDYQPSLEHVIPKGRGGSNKLENLMLAHRICNQQRGTKMLTRRARRMWMIVRAAVELMRQGQSDDRRP